MVSYIYTIGYESAAIQDFIATLLAVGIKQIIDVRDVPLSRKRGFSKTSLQAILETQGITYIHLKGLGDPKSGREAARAGDFNTFRRIFNTHMQSKIAQSDLETAMQIASETPSCLLCFERKPEECHRTIVAKAISAQTGLKDKPIGVKAGLGSNHLAQSMYL